MFKIRARKKNKKQNKNGYSLNTTITAITYDLLGNVYLQDYEKL